MLAWDVAFGRPTVAYLQVYKPRTLRVGEDAESLKEVPFNFQAEGVKKSRDFTSWIAQKGKD